jgi:hypothetical protein
MSGLLGALRYMVQGVSDIKNIEANKANVDATKGKLLEDAERALTVQKVSIVTGLAGVALAGLAVSCFAAGEEKMGTALLCVDTALLISSYNSYTASENFRSQVYESPLELMVITAAGNPVTINQVALRKCLLNGTLFFEPALGFYAEVVIRSLDDQQ